MTIRERIHAEVDRLPDEELEKLLPVVEGMREKSGANGANGGEPSIFDKLLKYQFHGPKDLSRNFELYASGEKRFEDETDVR
jgi:hypothetical protein